MSFFNDLHIWVLFSFLIFLFIALKKGGRKFLALLDNGIAAIRNDIETAKRLKAEAADLLATYEKKQQEAAREAEDIVAKARIAAEDIRKGAEKDLQDLMERKEALLAGRLVRMEEAAKAEIQAYAADLAVKATAEIIASKLDGAANDRLVAASTRAIAGHLK